MPAEQLVVPLLKSQSGKSMGAMNGVSWRVMVSEVAAAPLTLMVFVLGPGKEADRR